jgi:diguanylate cyclase (GGDEF)-like protein/PAS domain S-box-containing protein
VVLKADPGVSLAPSPTGASVDHTNDLVRLLIDDVVDYAILMLDASGRVATWNPGAQRFKGYQADEIIGKHFSIFYPPEDVVAGKPQQLLETAAAKGRIEDEGWRVRQDGTRFWANVVITALRDHDGVLAGFGKITRDLTERRAADLELRASEERFRLMVEGVQDYAILMLDADGNVATWNDGAQRFKGYHADEIIGKHFSVFYPPEDVAAGKPEQLLETAAATGRIEDEGWRVRQDGTRFWANVVITALRGHDGALAGFGKITRDLTERRAGELELRASEERFRLMVENVADYGILMLDADGNVATWNSGAQRIKGYRADEIIGKHFSIFYPPEEATAGKPQRCLETAIKQGRFQEEGWRMRQDGTRFWANVVITALRDRDGVLRGFGKITRDRSYEQELEQLADRDPLTGVLNRRSFGRELASHVSRVARYGASGSVLMIDLDHFKHFNDTQGHSAGDELLVRVSHAMQSRLRDIDVLARLGGDEFAVLLGGGDEPGTEAIADALLQVVREQSPAIPNERNDRVTASVGIARFSDEERLTAEEILANADLAMYDAKKGGRDRWARYTAQRHSRPNIEHRAQWADRIDNALANDGFVLLAQPIVAFKADDIPKYELLLRMRGAEGGFIAPDAFLTIAERLGRIGDIDRWVTLRAIEILAQQRTLGRDVSLEVNLSGSTIGDTTFLELVERRLSETRVVADRLVFEVTETAAVAHVARAVRFAERLSELGCGFALDNFGAGSGSFYHIKQLRFDYLKIDGEFVQHCADNETDRILISAIVRIAQAMGKVTIAGFVEDHATAAMLPSLGVDYGQGFYFGRPAPL